MEHNKLKNQSNLMQKIISLCKRRGFVFPSSEIYGGFGSCYDFGPLGVELKNNIKKNWWKEMIQNQESIVGLDAAILMNPKVWEASGHLTAGFADELVECKKCRKRFKIEEICRGSTSADFVNCPECKGELSDSKKFNLMMKTFVGPVEDDAAISYLRAETCQGIYVNFLNVLNSARQKIPFGIVQIGKAFRNEITPGNFIFRMREFEQMEMQYFVVPSQSKIKNFTPLDNSISNGARKSKIKNKIQNSKFKTPDEWFIYWKNERLKWYYNLGIKKENLRAVEIPAEKRAHYAKKQVDIEYKFPFGWKEVEGVHNRGDWDLSNHTKHSGQDLRYYNEETKEKYFPHIIETSVGVERSLLAFLCEAYQEVEGGRTKTTKSIKEKEIVLKLHKDLAPIKVAVLPLVKNKPEIVKKAKEIYQILKSYFICEYDESGAIGKRYRRHDEIGTPFAVTIDFKTLEKDDVTVRDRDTMEQKRIKIKNLIKILK